MKSFGRGFERLPTEHELEYYRPSQPSLSYQAGPEHTFQAGFVNSPRPRYEPLSNNNNSNSSPLVRHDVQPSWTSSSTIKVLVFLSHLVLTLTPVAFIILAFLALSVDGDPLSSRGRNVYQAAKLGPTVFPIIFAAVVGRLMKTLALWRAEKGSTIGVLEQLNGSQNLLAAIERFLLVSTLWGWGLGIIALWALSPLGGQSSLRVLDLASSGDDFSQQLDYFNTDEGNGTIFIGASAIASGLPAVQAIYQACLLAPASISRSSVDIWGNVKIPLMQAQPGYTGSPQQDWIDIVHRNDTVYSSLTGIVVSGLRSDASASFTLESSYMNFTCPTPTVFQAGGVYPNATSEIITDFQKWMGNVLVHRNASRTPFDRAFGTSGGWISFMVDTNYNFTGSGTPNTRPVNLIYAARNVDQVSRITAYNCSVGMSHVESLIGCNGTNCRVDKMRPSQLNTGSPISTPFNQVSSYSVLVNFLDNFPFLSGAVHSAETSPADYYIAGNSTPFQPVGQVGTNYANITNEQVSHRLGALINTAWQGSLAQSFIASPPPDQSVFRGKDPPFSARSSNATMRVSQIVYRASKLWVGLTATVSFVLFFCGLAGIMFRYLTTAPDILGYVSTMTRDNPFFNDHRAAGADNLDGLERARLLRDAVVQISDVRPWQGGHIALKSVAAGEDREAGRLYLRRKPLPQHVAPI